jgi:hypothetical protein
MPEGFTAQNNGFRQGFDFVESGFPNCAKDGRLKPKESARFENPKRKRAEASHTPAARAKKTPMRAAVAVNIGANFPDGTTVGSITFHAGEHRLFSPDGQWLASYPTRQQAMRAAPCGRGRV